MPRRTTKYKNNRSKYFLHNIAWPVASLVLVITAWIMMSRLSAIGGQYVNSINTYIGLSLALSIACAIAGVWKADFKWKFVSVAIAIIWLVPFLLFFMSFAGPLFTFNLVG